MYALLVKSGEYNYPLGLYLGNVKKEQGVNYLKGFHPTLAQAIIFEHKEDAESVAKTLNQNYNSNAFEVINLDELDGQRKIMYQWE